MNHAERVFYLFDQIKARRKADEAYAQLAQQEKQQDRLVGDSSERTVLEVLQGLPSVQVAQRTKTYSPEDNRAIDLIVRLRGNYTQIGIPTVHVQVKSGAKRIETFLEETRRRHSLSPAEVELWLQRERLILLNGREDREVIANSFNQQLERIREFYINGLHLMPVPPRHR